LEENHVKALKRLNFAISNFAQWIVLWTVGELGPLATVYVEEVVKYELDPSSWPLLVERNVDRLTNLKFAIPNPAP